MRPWNLPRDHESNGWRFGWRGGHYGWYNSGRRWNNTWRTVAEIPGKSINARFNKEKCKIRQTQVLYVKHLLTSEGLKIHPRKVKAVQEMPELQRKEDMKLLRGYVQFLSRYLPRLSTVDAPRRELEKKKVLFHWDHLKKESFGKIKKLVSEAPVLQYYDVTKPVTIQCDASGKGAVLLQDDKPVCCASWVLTGAESRYAPIEAEMLAVVFARCLGNLRAKFQGNPSNSCIV